MGPERKVCGNHHRSLSVRLWAMTVANNDNGLFFPGGAGDSAYERGGVARRKF